MVTPGWLDDVVGLGHCKKSEWFSRCRLTTTMPRRAIAGSRCKTAWRDEPIKEAHEV
jgi:hypothetical protein